MQTSNLLAHQMIKVDYEFISIKLCGSHVDSLTEKKDLKINWH